MNIFRPEEDGADEDFVVATYLMAMVLRNIGTVANVDTYKELRDRFKIVMQSFIIQNPTVEWKNIGFSIKYDGDKKSLTCECKPCYITPDSCEVYKLINSPQKLRSIGMDFRVSDPQYFGYISMLCSMLFLGNNFGTSDKIFSELEKLMYDAYLELMKETGAQIWDNIFTLIYRIDEDEWQIEVRERHVGKVKRVLDR